MTASPPLVEKLPAAAAMRVLLAAAAAGVGAQLLFVGQRPGINVLLWVAVVLVAAWRLRRPGVSMDPADGWLAPTALTFAAFLALRDDLALRAFDLPAAGLLTLCAVFALGGTAVTRCGWAGLAGLAAAALALVVGGATRLSAGLAPLAGSLGRDARLLAVLPLLRGLLVAVPLVIAFVALFAAADAVFAGYVGRLFELDVDLSEVVYRSLFAGAAAWLVAGTIVCAWLARPAGDAGSSPKAGPRIGRPEALVVLLSLNMVFVVFVVLQAAYLFGGLDTLEISGMTYSEYARRGFFELIAVALLAGTVILAIDRLVADRSWVYRAAAAALAGLTGVVLLSAVVRLGLYQAAYGWTELRFYALAAICWLALGVVATMAALVLDRAALVARLMVGFGLAIALLVNAVGPQAFVTDQNLQRAIDPSLVAPGGESGLDLDYLGLLGNEAIPSIVAALERLPADSRAEADRLLRRAGGRLAAESRELGWPSWNLARERAIGALTAGGYLTAGE